jgi:uncharacterized protein YgiM (DUF1202 family)
MKGFVVGVTKLILGVAIAVMLLSMAGVATARYFMARLSVLPPRPVFDNELPIQPPPDVVTPPPVVEAPPPAEVTATETTPELEEGSYEAVVVQPIGLVLREGPGTEFPQVGGVDYNEDIIVIEEPDGKSWIRVRVVSSGQEGWVKAGNTRRADG